MNIRLLIYQLAMITITNKRCVHVKTLLKQVQNISLRHKITAKETDKKF